MPLTHRLAALTTVALITLGGSLGGSACADDPEPSGAPPGSTTTSPPPDVDANSPGLKLADGATLAAGQGARHQVRRRGPVRRRAARGHQSGREVRAPGGGAVPEGQFQAESGRQVPDPGHRRRDQGAEGHERPRLRLHGRPRVVRPRADALEEARGGRARRTGGIPRFAGPGHHVRGARLQRGLPDRRQQQRRGPQEEPPGGGVVPEGAATDSGGSDGSADTGQ